MSRVFQPAIGGIGINPLVNTQFQYIPVGVNEISSVHGFVTIGGIQQPVIGQRVVNHGSNALIDENLPVVELATREPGNPASEVRKSVTVE